MKATWPKEKLVTQLKQSFKFCEDALAQLDDAKLADQITMTLPNGQTAHADARRGGDRTSHRHGGSLQPALELHAAEQHPAADGAAASAADRLMTAA